MTYQIFISYRRLGGEALAFLLKERLKQDGYNIFFDIESLHGGKFNEEILKVIDECNTMLVILSPDALDRCNNENDWVLTEISYAISKNKRIIPIFTNGFTWPNKLPEKIQELQFFNGVAVNYDFFDGFIKKLYNLITTNEENSNNLKENKNHLILWGDFEKNVLNKFTKRLNLSDSYELEIIDEPTDILQKDLSHINCIILFDTDVTKLSNTDFTLKRLNEALETFVLNGGKLIATHDIIYRRTRNKLLQKMFGCCIDSFRQVDLVCYKKIIYL